MRRLEVRAANWKSPIDCVSRGSSTGGSQDEARVRTPPGLGGLELGGIQSGYGETGWADRRARPAPTIRTPIPAPPHPARLRNSRRFTRWRRATGPSVGILALLLYLVVKERTRAGTGPECGEHAGCEQRSQEESAGSCQWTYRTSRWLSGPRPRRRVSGLRTAWLHELPHLVVWLPHAILDLRGP